MSANSKRGNPDRRTCRGTGKEPPHSHFQETGGNGEYCPDAGQHASYKDDSRARSTEQPFSLLNVIPIHGEPAAVSVQQWLETLHSNHSGDNIPEEISQHRSCRSGDDDASEAHFTANSQPACDRHDHFRSEEHTSELQSL